MVSQEGRAVKLDKLSMCRQEAQLKKRSFVEKFFPLINKKSDKETADTMTTGQTKPDGYQKECFKQYKL